jgi:heptosyltransferase III
MTDLQNIRSILVIKLRNIGDVLLTSPLFANLRLHFPESRICALVNSGTEEMLTDNPDIDEIYVYSRSVKQEPWKKRIRAEIKLLASIRRGKFDLVINLTEGDRGAIVALASGARLRIGMDSLKRGFKGKDKIYTTLLPLPPGAMHAVDQNLRYLEPLGLKVIHKKVTFCLQDDIVSKTEQRLRLHGLEPKNYFHAHVTSRWMFKTMPPATAACLLNLLAKRSGLPCLLTSSPERKELDYLEEVQKFLAVPDALHFSDLLLKEVGAISSMSRFFVGVDSAPMHMAAALNIPVLGIFGPSVVQAWGPWNNSMDNTPYINERGIQKNGKHVVLQSDKSCVPCDRDGCNGSKVSDCLNFSLDQLNSALDIFLI